MYTCLPEGITELPENSGGEFAHFKELNHLLAAGSGMEIGNPFDVRKLMSDSWQEINDLKKTAVFHGWVTYKHVFSAMEDCKSEFCYVYTPSAQRLSSVGRHTRYK